MIQPPFDFNQLYWEVRFICTYFNDINRYFKINPADWSAPSPSLPVPSI